MVIYKLFVRSVQVPVTKRFFTMVDQFSFLPIISIFTQRKRTKGATTINDEEWITVWKTSKINIKNFLQFQFIIYKFEFEVVLYVVRCTTVQYLLIEIYVQTTRHSKPSLKEFCFNGNQEIGVSSGVFGIF